jgi:gluconolactonase
MQLTAFDVAADGSLSNRRVLVDFGKELGIDGMAVDATGRVFAAVRSSSRFGIAVYDATGRELDFLKTESLPTNCGFGVGNDAATLYITAGGGLYRVTVQSSAAARK